MRVFVYKSRRKPDTYLYLAEHDAFDAVPEPMQVTLRPWQFVLEFDLTPDRRLPRINARVLQNNLVSQGFHLLFPVNVLDPLVAGGVGDG